MRSQNYGKATKEFITFNCLRFLRARKFNMVDTKLMVKNYINHLREIEKLEGVDFERKFRVIREIVSNGYYGIDKQGNPVYIDRIGLFDYDKFARQVDQENLIDYYAYRWRQFFEIILPFCAHFAGRKVERITSIIDCTNVQYSVFFRSKIRNAIKEAVRISQDYYPELISRVFVVNAPWSVKAIWNIVKNWIDAKTRKRIIIRREGRKELLEFIDRDQLPVWLWGTNREPMNDFSGPWRNEIRSGIDRRTWNLNNNYWDYYLTSQERKLLDQ